MSKMLFVLKVYENVIHEQATNFFQTFPINLCRDIKKH